MANKRFIWHKKGFEELRRVEKLDALLFQKALDIANDANDIGKAFGYIPKSGLGKSRDRAAVLTSNMYTMTDNAKNHTLIKAVTRNVGKR